MKKNDYSWGGKEKLFNFTFFNKVLNLSGYQVIFKASNTNNFNCNYSAPPMGMSNRLTVVLQQELH